MLAFLIMATITQHKSKMAPKGAVFFLPAITGKACSNNKISLCRFIFCVLNKANTSGKKHST